MPEIIDLIDSSPPPQPSRLQPPPSTQARHSSVRFSSPYHPGVPAATKTTTIPASSPNYLSSDFDSSLFTFETPGRSAKKRKLTPQGERAVTTLPPPLQLAEAQPRDVAKSSTQTVPHSDYSLFTFSDDIEPPSLPTVSRADAGTSTAATTSTTAHAGLSTSKTKTYKWNGEESDPIVFTSSAPEPTTSNERQQSRLNKPSDDSRTKNWPSVITIDDDFDEIQDWSDPFNVSLEDPLDKLLDDPRPSLKPAYSDRTAALLASLRTDDNTEKKATTTSKPKKSTANFDNLDLDFGEDSLSDVPARPTETSKTKRKPNVDAEEKAAKAREREATREQRKREKEAEKERKRLEKEEKAKEKQLAADIAEVNKSKIHKKESMPEMIVDMASTFEGTSVGNQVVEYLKTLGAEHTFFQSSMPNIVKWRRKKRSEYNEDAARWQPCQPYIATEDHVLCMLPAQEFVDMVICEDDTQTLDGHVQRLKNSYRDCKPIYLIDGLVTWMRRNQNSRNRAYQAEVLAQINNFNDSIEHASTQSKQRRRTTKKAKKPEDTPPVADDTIEDALLELQVTHNCLIYHTNAAGETAEWIKNFSEHISTVPYRHVQMGNYDTAAFCMETGQVKTGEDKVDTFVKMLQEINRVTAPMAYGITSQYPSAVDLLHAMKKHGPTLLENVRKSANKNGALTDSRIGPAVSKRLYKVFMGLDETSADI